MQESYCSSSTVGGVLAARGGAAGRGWSSGVLQARGCKRRSALIGRSIDGSSGISATWAAHRVRRENPCVRGSKKQLPAPAAKLGQQQEHQAALCAPLQQPQPHRGSDSCMGAAAATPWQQRLYGGSGSCTMAAAGSQWRRLARHCGSDLCTYLKMAEKSTGAPSAVASTTCRRVGWRFDKLTAPGAKLDDSISRLQTIRRCAGPQVELPGRNALVTLTTHHPVELRHALNHGRGRLGGRRQLHCQAQVLEHQLHCDWVIMCIAVML